MFESTSAAEQILAAYADAVARTDAAQLAALYDADAVIYDAWDNWLLAGREAVLAMATAWFGSLGSERVEVTFRAVRCHGSGTVVACSALATYTAVAADGIRLRATTNRLTLVLQASAVGWQIVHEHTSVPVGFGSKQAIPFPSQGA